ncbi:MAG: LysM peptidoglycan-binding domain-containing protein, partial [Gemmatimonadota bacterium]
VHTVRSGDTLWDLAARFLDDPLRWRTIFELNPAVVEDPHWIYPGEELRIPGADAVADLAPTGRAGADRDGGEIGMFPAGSVFRQPPDAGPGLSALALDQRPPLATVTSDDFHRAPLLVGPGELGSEGVTVRVLEENPLDLRMPTAARKNVDVVVALGGLEPGVGDSLKGVRFAREEGVHGRVVIATALLEVTRLWADSARATVVKMYGDYAVGDPVVAVAPYDLDPAARPEQVDDGVSGDVIAFAVPQVLLGPGEFLFLDVGADRGVRVGDEFAVFSRKERDGADTAVADALAVVRVVRVADRTSTGRVIGVRDPGMRAGDPVRLIRRLSPTGSSTSAPSD